jgi:hypothetical protein
MAVSAFPSGALAATCVVGDESKGYWKWVDGPNQGKCIIPGPPHPDSPFLNHTGISGSGAFRIEGKYKVATHISGKGWYPKCPESGVPVCITGFAAWACEGYGTGNGFIFDPSTQLCRGPDWTYGCASFTDGENVFLFEWVWTNKDCEKEEPPSVTPNPDPGKPGCPQVPLN